MPSLVLLENGTETRHDLGDRPVVVGRSAEADIQVPAERASRSHFRLEPTDRGWVVRDLDSSNGTAVNGYFVSRALLTPGDVLEAGGATLRFDGDGPPPAPRAPRPEAKRPSSGPAWIAALVSIASVVVVSDIVAVEAARDTDREIEDTLARAAHAEFVVAGRTTDPAESEKLLREYLAANPAHADAAAARLRVGELESRREVRAAAAAEFQALAARSKELSPQEWRWRLENLVRRWCDVPEAMDEIRSRAEGAKGPAAPAEDGRLVFVRRKREADAAAADGNLGRALAVWNAHALENPPTSASAEADLRAEVRRVHDQSATRAEECMASAARMRDEGKGEESERLLKDGAEALGETVGGRRLRAFLDAGFGRAGGGVGGKGGAGSEEGYAKKRALYLRAREAEQFVALRDYGAAAGLYAGVALDAKELPEVAKEMEERSGWLRRVSSLLDAVRSGQPDGWKGKPWPATWEEVAAEDLYAAMLKAAKAPGDRATIAAFAYDQTLRKEARAAVAAALEVEATRAEAERLYSVREGIPIPEGGFVAEKGEILSRDEWKRRRNAEAIARLLKKQESLVRKLHDAPVVRGIDKMRQMRAELDKRRAHALELIFDEVRYFYPYQDRQGEYTKVQQEVDERVKKVREIWEEKGKFRTKADATAAAVLKDLEDAARQLRELGAPPAAAEKEVEAMRIYLDRDLDLRTFFLDAGEAALLERDRAVMADNAKRKTAADETEAKQVEITNEYRMMFGRRAVAIQDKLVLSARAHGDDMSRGGFFAHDNQRLNNMKPGEKIPKQACGCSSDGFIPGCTHGPDCRIRAQGYEFAACSENIHMGSGDPLGAHMGWIHSSGHHRNILHTAWTEMGTGRVGSYWTQNFGLPSSAAEAASEGAGTDRWDDAGGRGTGGDGNPPRGE